MSIVEIVAVVWDNIQTKQIGDTVWVASLEFILDITIKYHYGKLRSTRIL